VLRETQLEFMRGILDGAAVAGIVPPAALSIYANNARVSFIETLKRTYPAIWRLVGEDYFRQSAREFQHLHPSRSGDLQHVGERFAEYLVLKHGNDNYAYLADVARLEWAYQEALIDIELAPLNLARLALVDSLVYPHLQFSLQPSVRLVESRFPILAIWEVNVADELSTDECIDLNAGADRLLVLRAFNGVRIHRLDLGELTFLRRMEACDAFAPAVERAGEIDPSFDACKALQKLVALRAIVNFHF
jgi:hypothetical protein